MKMRWETLVRPAREDEDEDLEIHRGGVRTRDSHRWKERWT